MYFMGWLGILKFPRLFVRCAYDVILKFLPKHAKYLLDVIIK